MEHSEHNHQHESDRSCCENPSKKRSPVSARLLILVGAILAVAGLYVVVRYTPWGASLVYSVSNGGTRLLPLVIGSALVDSINPCAFSVLLLTVAFLFNLGRLRGRILTVGLAYIAGLFLVYLLIGLGLLQALHLFNTPHFMAKVGATLLLLLGGLALINALFPKFPIKVKIPAKVHGAMSKLIDRASMPTAFVLGWLVGLCEFPCTGGPYLTVLGLLHDKVTYVRGIGFLLLYNAVFVLPLVLLLLLASERSLLERVRGWQQRNKRTMHLIAGIAMVLIAVLIFVL